MKTSSVIIGCLLFSVSCSKVKELDKRTESMEKSTDKMSATTDNLKDTTAVMYEQIRSKEAEATRNTKFEILMDDKASIGERITAAGVFYKSLEFQLWTGNKTFDTPEYRKVLYLDAANEYTRRLIDLYDRIDVRKLNPTLQGKRHSDEMSFYALAAAMHMNHTFQDTLTQRDPSVEETSMYDLIKKALKKDHEQRHLEEYEVVLMNGINKEIMIELLKARVDMLAAIGLCNLTDQRKMNIAQLSKGLLFKVTFGRFGSIDLPELYDTTNDATKDSVTEELEGAVKTKRFLATIGIEKHLEKTIASAFKNLDFNEAKHQDDKSVDKKKEKIKTLIDELLE